MQASSPQKKIMKGFFWKFGERLLSQGISFIISIVLARLLAPSDYGMVTAILIYINIANVLITNGVSDALIQKKDANREDFSTLFWVSLSISLVIYIIIYAASPIIANLRGDPEFAVMLRVLGLMVPLTSVAAIQHAYVAKRLQFKKYFFATMVGAVLSGITGILMAVNGYGPWALICQYLVSTFSNIVVLAFVIDWHPGFVFNKNSAKGLLTYGWKITASSLLNSIYGEFQSLIIGVKYTDADLAYYKKGISIPSLLITNIDSATGSVLFPAMAAVNDDEERIKHYTRISLKVSMFIVTPMMVALAIMSKNVIKVLLTDAWTGCVPFAIIGCIYYAMQPIQTANWQAVKAMGRSDLCLKYELIKKIIGILVTLFIARFGVLYVGLSLVLNALISCTLNMTACAKVIHYRIIDQLKDISLTIVMSFAMGGIVYLVGTFQLPTILLLCVQTIVGATFYFILAKLLHEEAFNLLLNLVFKRRK